MGKRNKDIPKNAKPMDEAMQNELFFIRSATYQNHYLHPSGEDEDGNDIYQLKNGSVGAAMWKEEQAILFIKMMKLCGMEIINLKGTKILSNNILNAQNN